MIQYLRHKEIDKIQWDACIERSQRKLIYAYSWYLDIVSPNWCALIKDDYQVIMPLPVRKKFGLSYIIQPYFTQQLGVFGEDINPQVYREMLDKLQHKFMFADIKVNGVSGVSFEGLVTDKNTNFELSLNEEYDTLFQQFSANHKKNIRSSRNKKLSISHDLSSDEFVAFCRENLSAKIEHEIPKRHWDILKLLIDSLSKTGNCKLYRVNADDGTLIAGAMLASMNNRWYLLLNSSNERGRRNRALYFLIDSFIKEHAGKLEILDFEGSNIESIAYFFKGFAAQHTRYGTLKFNRLPKFIKRFKS